MNEEYLSVATDFSNTPGPRSADEGDYDGETFLKSVLAPRFRECQQRQKVLLVDLDGTEGYATSFLEAAFGGLAREFGIKNVLNGVRIKTMDEPFLEEEIIDYINRANDQK